MYSPGGLAPVLARDSVPRFFDPPEQPVRTQHEAVTRTIAVSSQIGFGLMVP